MITTPVESTVDVQHGAPDWPTLATVEVANGLGRTAVALDAGEVKALIQKLLLAWVFLQRQR
ncbi:hypothetical protein ACFWU5_16490 [Nocardia sp. NPDC058640]|uniref:hypothetical protein n=1 Tax=Nocardia sp. NPDC058640 TaxID=3346571 RepID=UPI00364F0453